MHVAQYSTYSAAQTNYTLIFSSSPSDMAATASGCCGGVPPRAPTDTFRLVRPGTGLERRDDSGVDPGLPAGFPLNDAGPPFIAGVAVPDICT